MPFYYQFESAPPQIKTNRKRVASNLIALIGTRRALDFRLGLPSESGLYPQDPRTRFLHIRSLCVV